LTAQELRIRELRTLARSCGAASWVEDRTRRITPLIRATHGTKARETAEVVVHSTYLAAVAAGHARRFAAEGDDAAAAEHRADYERGAANVAEFLGTLNGRTRRRVDRLLRDLP
jgi:hypothetical protein